MYHSVLQHLEPHHRPIDCLSSLLLLILTQIPYYTSNIHGILHRKNVLCYANYVLCFTPCDTTCPVLIGQLLCNVMSWDHAMSLSKTFIAWAMITQHSPNIGLMTIPGNMVSYEIWWISDCWNPVLLNFTMMKSGRYSPRCSPVKLLG